MRNILFSLPYRKKKKEKKAEKHLLWSYGFDKAILKPSICLSGNEGTEVPSILLVLLATNALDLEPKSFDFVLELKSRADNVHENFA